MEQKHYDSSGQVLLITLLVLTVAMTIGLSLIGRTRTNLTISTDVEESARAFSAAEAGVEQALKAGSLGSTGAQLLSGAPTSYTTTVSSVGAAVGAYGFPQRTVIGDTETLWLVNHNANQTLNEVVTYNNNQMDVCWRGSSGTPALSVTVLFKRGNAYMTAKAAFDPNGVRRATNNFAVSGALTTACGQNNVYRRTLSFSSFSVVPPINAASDVLLALRLRPLYADADLFVDTGGTALPSQGNLVSSTGSTGTGVTRKILVSQQFRSPPSIFDAAVVSQSTFSH